MVIEECSKQEEAWADDLRMVEGSFRRKTVPPSSLQLFLEIEEGLVREQRKVCNQMVLRR